MGRIIGNAAPHPATGSTLKKLPPPQPTPCNMDCNAIFSLILTLLDHTLYMCAFVICKTFYAK